MHKYRFDRNNNLRGISSCLLILTAIFVLTKSQYNKLYNPVSQPTFSKIHQNYLRSIKQVTASSTLRNRTKLENKFYNGKVWLASGISVFIISAVGLLGVAVVPLVQKVFYNKIIQYLVALAVGSLTGDAFLHLLPHAIAGGHGHGHDEGTEAAEEEEATDEFTPVLKGLVALGGVYFFFLAEKFLSMISDYRAEKRAEEEERQRQLKDPRRSELRRLSAMQLSIPNPGGNRRGSHLGSPRDDAMFRRLSKVVTADDEDEGIITTGLSSRAMKSVNNLIRFSELDVEDNDIMTTMTSSGHGNKTQGDSGGYLSVPGVTVTYNSGDEGGENKKKEDEEKAGDGEVTINVPSPTKPPSSGAHVTIKMDDDPNNNSTHHGSPSKPAGHDGSMSVEVKDPAKQGGHGHGHSHEVPGSIAAVAWMVILGDGLHNFSDGLAIGAAFADKISGGVSTAVAVFCHELPHELGDFAVLLKTGMSVKQALFYNIVSSVLCFIGMLIGIALNNVDDASYWIFAVTAGTFVYIALVDMLPELNSADVRPGESRIAHFLIQNLGLATGVGIMFLIAVFEENIKSMLG